ncbi:MAG: Arc family DNA-binding protein [Burkholderiales bacterium]|nr:MAG: Arc family DNA-binding protein [Burkholderiales bacterium]
MPTLTIRNVDETLREALRMRAARSGRSMEEEVRQILRQALLASRAECALGSRVSQRFAALGGVDLPVPARSRPRRVPELGIPSGECPSERDGVPEGRGRLDSPVRRKGRSAGS